MPVRPGEPRAGERGAVSDYDRFLREVCPGLGLNWRKYRRRTARRRLAARLGELGLGDLAAYRQRLAADPAEAARLPELLRVTVSRFFRERPYWTSLAETVLPPILAAKGNGAPLRAWSAGCCSGEEPYTLAILWLERLQPRYPGHPLEMLATDIDPEVLARARAARYPGGALREMEATVRDHWFVPTRGEWQLADRIRELVRFKRQDLLGGEEPGGLDLVLCRYLAFTYYRGDRLLAAARVLHRALRPGGWLMIGRKEGLAPALLELFRPQPGLPAFFRKI
jgi:chemotaxis methyl-accepting protein methylase